MSRESAFYATTMLFFLIRLYLTFSMGVFPGSPLCGMEGESRLKMRDVMIIAR